MKFKIILILFLFLNINSLTAQDYIFFDESQSSEFYYPSFGFVNEPSSLSLIGIKFPVSDSIKFSGSNSLKLNWISSPSGDWGLAVAEPGWIAHDVNQKDFISFYVYSVEGIDSSAMPVIYLEDLSNAKTPKQNLEYFTSSILPEAWIAIVVPLQPFKGDPDSADLTQIKTIFFGQSEADEVEHTMFIDEIRIKSENINDTIRPSVPKNFVAKGYEKHIDLSWDKNSETDLSGYYIYKKENNEFKIISTIDRKENFYIDFIDETGVGFEYKISAYNRSGIESELSAAVSASTKEMDDEEFLDMVQETTFRYFWDFAHPQSGMIRERYRSDNTVTTGGSGFGVMAILVGSERGYISREEGAERLLTILDFLKNKTARYHGAWAHWINGATGSTIPFSQYDNGGDLVETAFMIQGLLTAREYFDSDIESENQIRSMITELWEDVEWDWYRRLPYSDFLFWHWSPDYNWRINLPIRGWNETMIVYLLAIASPSHSVPADLYESGWVRSGYENGKSFYGIPLFVGPDYAGPLFFTHYSFLGFDPRNKRDAHANYFEHNRNAALVHRAYTIDNPEKFTGYGEKTFGDLLRAMIRMVIPLIRRCSMIMAQ